MNYDELKRKSTDLRLRILDMIVRAGQGDMSLSFSAVEAFLALYFGEENRRLLARYEAKKPKSAARDYVVVSDPSLAPVWYACLSEAGFFNADELDAFARPAALLSYFPHAKIPGVDVSVSRPGKGLAIAEGLARTLHLNKRENRVWVVLTDADLAQGLTWEALLGIAYARFEHVSVLCLTVGVQKLKPLPDKFSTFGWKVLSLVDGHDIKEVTLALARAQSTSRQPVCVVAPVRLGKGVPFLEGKLEYRGALLSLEEIEMARSHLLQSSI